MIPLAVPNLGELEREYLSNCIDTTFVSSVGEYVRQLEERSAAVCGAKYGVAVSAGTTGLHAALLTLGVQPGELVIMPSFTFIASANAVSHCGAQPWLFDIDDKWTIDAEHVEKALGRHCERRTDGLYHRDSGRRVAAIMPVYTLGNIPDMDALRGIADTCGLPLIADAACAIGATYHGRTPGDLADMSVLSFNGNKTITCGGGGMILGNDSILMEKARHLTTTARVGAEYEFDMVGYNYRMTNIQAAVGCAQLKRLDAFIATKRHVRAYYSRALSDLEGISFFPETKGASDWFSGIVLSEECGLMDVRGLVAELKEKGIEARTFWKPVHLQKPYAQAPREDLSRTEALWGRIATLPCSTGITEDELAAVAAAVREWALR